MTCSDVRRVCLSWQRDFSKLSDRLCFSYERLEAALESSDERELPRWTRVVRHHLSKYGRERSRYEIWLDGQRDTGFVVVDRDLFFLVEECDFYVSYARYLLSYAATEAEAA